MNNHSIIKSIFKRFFYIYWFSTKDNWKIEIEKNFVGQYELTQFRDCSDCILELKDNNKYSIFNSTKNHEIGSWKYFDDGDIAFIEFDNGGQLGNNEYSYLQKQ